MNFVLQTPSLRHLAGVKIVTHLWTQRDIFTQIPQSCNQYHGYALKHDKNEWKGIEEKVESKVWVLPLPQAYKKQLLNLIKPLGIELIFWCSYHCEEKNNFQFLVNMLPQQLCWTMHGTIDYSKTAELMVKDERLDVERRYEIACINCLEDQARQLFHSMSKERRGEYVNRVRHFRRNDHHHLIVYFTCTLTADVVQLHRYFQTMMLRSQSSLNKCLFEMMLCRGNRVTCEYLFKKLEPREKEQIFKECKCHYFSRAYAHSNRSVLYLLSLMNEDQQRKYNHDPLQCLLRWPMQPLFMEAAEWRWGFMDKDACCAVLKCIIDKIYFGLQDYDYCQLFWECWRLSRAEYKKNFLSNHRLLGDFFLTKREEFIQLAFNEGFSRFIEHVVNRNDIHQVLMEESVISDAALMECKETAALNSENDKENAEKRLKSEHLTRLVDIVMEERMKRRV